MPNFLTLQKVADLLNGEPNRIGAVRCVTVYGITGYKGFHEAFQHVSQRGRQQALLSDFRRANP